MERISPLQVGRASTYIGGGGNGREEGGRWGQREGQERAVPESLGQNQEGLVTDETKMKQEELDQRIKTLA